MIVNRFDSALAPDGSIFGVGHQLLSYGSYDRGEIDFVLDRLRGLRKQRGDGLFAIDVGANVGVHAVSWGREMTGWGRVLAFEPQELIYYALAGNVVLANAFNVEARRAAVGSESGSIRIPKPDYARNASFGSLELKHSRDVEFIGQPVSYLPRDLVEVPIVAIDDLNFSRLDFLKVDAERMDFEVLLGARSTIERYRPEVLVEWFKVGIEEFRYFFEPLNYEITEFEGTLLGAPR